MEETNKYVVVLTRVYEVDAIDEEGATNIAFDEFEMDLEDGMINANTDSFSVVIKKV